MSEADYAVAVFMLKRQLLYLAISSGVMFIAADLIFRYMNWTLGISFKEHAWVEIKKNPIAVSIYFTGRIMAVFIAWGLIASSFQK